MMMGEVTFMILFLLITGLPSVVLVTKKRSAIFPRDDDDGVSREKHLDLLLFCPPASIDDRYSSTGRTIEESVFSYRLRKLGKHLI